MALLLRCGHSPLGGIPGEYVTEFGVWGGSRVFMSVPQSEWKNDFSS